MATEKPPALPNEQVPRDVQQHIEAAHNLLEHQLGPHSGAQYQAVRAEWSAVERARLSGCDTGLPSLSIGHTSGHETIALITDQTSHGEELIDGGGHVWKSADGIHFTDAGGHEKLLEIQKGANGQPIVDAKGERVYQFTDSQQPLLDPAVTAQRAEALYRAAGGAFAGATDADGRTMDLFQTQNFEAILSTKTAAERAAISQYLKEHHNLDLDHLIKCAPTDVQQRLLNLAHRTDGDTVGQHVDQIHDQVTELGSVGANSRRGAEIEKYIRDTYRLSTPDQIAQMEAQFQDKYHTSIQDYVSKSGASDQTKDWLKIYSDKSLTADQRSVQLAELALKNRDIDMWTEAMRDASQAVREQYAQEEKEQGRITKTFTTETTNVTSTGNGDVFATPITDTSNVQPALDAMNDGKISTATLVRNSSDTEQVEQALSNMSEEDRARFRLGQQIAEHGIDSLNADQRKLYDLGKEQADHPSTGQANKDALAFYNRVNEAQTFYKTLEDALVKQAGNPTELAAFEDQASTKGGSFVSNFTQNRHWYKNATAAELREQFQHMTKEQWEDLRAHPERTEAMKKIISTITDAKTTADFMAVYEAKVNKDNPSWTWEQARSASGFDTVSNLAASTNRHQAARDFVQAFLDDPKLATIVRKPEAERTPAENQLLANLKTQAERLLIETKIDGETGAAHTDDSLYKKYAEPLLRDGTLPLESLLAVHHDNPQQVVKDLLALSPAERQKIIGDHATLFTGFSQDQQKILLNVLQQGEFKPEDQARAAVIGWGGDLSKILTGARDHFAECQSDYQKKYGTLLESDVRDTLSKPDADHIFGQNMSQGEIIDRMRQEYATTHGSVGAGLLDALGDGAGGQAKEQLDQLVQQYREFQQKFPQATPEQFVQLQQRLTEAQTSLGGAIKLERTEVAKLSEEVAQMAVMGVTLFTAGGGTPFLLSMAAVSAMAKLGIKSYLQGDDYDQHTAGTDALTGFIDGLAGGAGGRLLGVASRSVASAMEKLGSETTSLLGQDGAQKLTAELDRLVREGVTTGRGVDQKAVRDLIQKIAAEGGHENVDVTALAAQVQSGLDQEFRFNLGRLIKEEFTVGVRGGVIGGTQGAADGIVHGQTLEEIVRSAAIGGAMFAGIAAGGHVIHELFRSATTTISAARVEPHEGETPGSVTPPAEIPAAAITNGRSIKLNDEISIRDDGVAIDSTGKPLAVQPAEIRVHNGVVEAEFRDTDGQVRIIRSPEPPTTALPQAGTPGEGTAAIVREANVGNRHYVQTEEGVVETTTNQHFPAGTTLKPLENGGVELRFGSAPDQPYCKFGPTGDIVEAKIGGHVFTLDAETGELSTPETESFAGGSVPGKPVLVTRDGVPELQGSIDVPAKGGEPGRTEVWVYHNDGTIENRMGDVSLVMRNGNGRYIEANIGPNHYRLDENGRWHQLDDKGADTLLPQGTSIIHSNWSARIKVSSPDSDGIIWYDLAGALMKL